MASFSKTCWTTVLRFEPKKESKRKLKRPETNFPFRLAELLLLLLLLLLFIACSSRGGRTPSRTSWPPPPCSPWSWVSPPSRADPGGKRKRNDRCLRQVFDGSVTFVLNDIWPNADFFPCFTPRFLNVCQSSLNNTTAWASTANRFGKSSKELGLRFNLEPNQLVSVKVVISVIAF